MLRSRAPYTSGARTIRYGAGRTAREGAEDVTLPAEGEALIIGEVAASPLTAWHDFYVIIGPAAATLTGLVFVVITLVAGMRERQSGSGTATFSTPTVVHFCAALGVAAALSAPWPAFRQAGVLLGLAGLAGAAYVAIVARRMRRQAAYQPVLEDWLWHVAFPLVSYGALVVAAAVLPGDPTPALFVVGAATVLLLFIGIHNAWDSVTYIVVERLGREGEGKD